MVNDWADTPATKSAVAKMAEEKKDFIVRVTEPTRVQRREGWVIGVRAAWGKTAMKKRWEPSNVRILYGVSYLSRRVPKYKTCRGAAPHRGNPMLPGQVIP